MVEKTKIELEIPQGVTVELQGDIVVVNGPLGQLRRNLYYPDVEISVDSGMVIVQTQNKRRKVYSVTHTLSSHIKNMIMGVSKGFSYQMKIIYSHFPIQVKVESDRVVVENFIGERQARYAKIVGSDTKIDSSKDRLTITGIDKEAVGQTMANIEQATRIKRFDPRVFQDGIYPVAKGTM